MYYFSRLNIAIILLSSMLLGHEQQSATCADAAACRQAALDAASRQDYETFHDFAWRALQKGQPNDPDAMLLVARAQSLSGRPADALVMLRRLAERGVAVDALTSDDFRRVRGLPGWPDVEAAIDAAASARKSKPSTTGATANPAVAKPDKPAAATKVESPRTDPRVDPPGIPSAGESTVRLAETALQPVGLAYDGVSRRFVVADSHANKLVVADVIFKQVNDLVGAGSGGFGTLTALEIDRRRGDLWVTSMADGGRASVHKLQLVSGRTLARFDVPDAWLPATLNDVSMSESGSLLLIDQSGSRLLTLPVPGRGFSAAMPLQLPAPASLATTGETIYVAHRDGLAAVDLKSRKVSEVRPSKGVVLAGLRRIRWHDGALIAIQTDESTGTGRLVRIRLAGSGRTASRIDRLDDQLSDGSAVLTIADGSAYYLARGAEGTTIRRVRLR